MEAPYATETSDSSAKAHYLSGWCPGCGRRRGADARCANCDPWWTSPLFHVGVPAVLFALFALSSAAALMRSIPASGAPAAPPIRAIHPPASVAAGLPESPYPVAVTPSVPIVVVVPAPPSSSAAPEGGNDVAFDAEAARAEQVRMLTFERARRDAEYLDTAVAAADRAQAEQEFVARNRALAASLQRSAAGSAGTSVNRVQGCFGGVPASGTASPAAIPSPLPSGGL